MPTDSPHVAVVGGGPGGLFAAYIVNQRLPGVRVTLFEATERLGGKVRTGAFSDGTPFEVGVAELYEYKGPGGSDPLRLLIEDDLALATVDMAGGGVVMLDKVLPDTEALADEFSRDTLARVQAFHRKAADLLPLSEWAHRWQPDNKHPWAGKTFRQCIAEEMPDDETARHYVETAIASDLATESHTCNGLNGIKNLLLDNEEYMQLYHVVGGIEHVTRALAAKIDADVRLGHAVRGVSRSGDGYRVHWQHDGAEDSGEFDAVLVAVPNHWLGQLTWGDTKLREAIHSILAHYDLPAHYLRVSVLFKKDWWEQYGLPGDFWMMDCFNGCCVYNESYRWRRLDGHVLSWLLAGQDALLQCSADQDDDDIVQAVLDALPSFMRAEAEANAVEGRVSRYVGSVNAQPGGWPAEELRGEHVPEPAGHPGLFLVGDYFFDSTLNAALMSAGVAVELLADFLGLPAEPGTEAVEQLETDGAALGLR